MSAGQTPPAAPSTDVPVRRMNVKRAINETLREEMSRYVRVQAALVLVQEDAAAAHAELETLRAMSPKHPVVTIAGPGIQAEFEASRAAREALGASAAQ